MVRRVTARDAMIVLLAAGLGLAGGGAAWVLLHLIGFLTNVALLHRTGWALPSLSGFHPDGTLVLTAVAGAAIAADAVAASARL